MDLCVQILGGLHYLHQIRVCCLAGLVDILYGLDENMIVNMLLFYAILRKNHINA